MGGRRTVLRSAAGEYHHHRRRHHHGIFDDEESLPLLKLLFHHMTLSLARFLNLLTNKTGVDPIQDISAPSPHSYRTPGPPQPPDIGTVAFSVLSMQERATPFTLQQQKW